MQLIRANILSSCNGGGVPEASDSHWLAFAARLTGEVSGFSSVSSRTRLWRLFAGSQRPSTAQAVREKAHELEVAFSANS